MTDRKTIEERMAQGFVPEGATQMEFRGPVALEYIAFFLGRIDKTLSEINAKIPEK